MSQGAHYRSDIDGLRAIAVAGVVIFHAFPQALVGGFAGVDVFFVISGFLIGGNIRADLEAGRFSFARFYHRRIRRLLPAMALVLLVTVLVASIMLVPAEFSTFTFTLRATILYASNIVFAMRTGYFDQPAAAAPLLHTWSLSVEEQFYLVCPLLLWALARYRPRLIVPALAGLALLSFIVGVDGVLRSPEKAFFLPHTRIWELLLGVLLAYRGALGGVGARGRTIAGLAGLMMILAAFALHSGERTPYPGLYALLPCLGTALLIDANRTAQTGVTRLLSASPMVMLGLISYPLYLWHWPVLVFMRQLGPEWSTPLAAAGAILASALMAFVTYRFVERPFRFAPGATVRGSYVALGALSVVFVGFSLLSEATKGLPQRFSADVRKVLDTGEEWRTSTRLACMRAGNDLAFAPRVAAGHPCRIGASGGIDAVLWGDSHAAALQPGLGEALERAGVGGIALTGGCTAVPHAGSRFAREERDCATRRRAVLDAFLASPARTLILAQRWTALIEGVMPVEREYRRADADAARDNATRLGASLREMTAELHRHGKRLILVDTVPEIAFHVPNTLGFRRNLRLVEPAGPALADITARQALTRATLRSALDGTGALIADPLEVLCDIRACAIQSAGTPLYFDNNHLTIAAKPMIGRMFDAALAASRRP